MNAIIRNILLTCVITMFCFFGAVGRKYHKSEMTPARVLKRGKNIDLFISGLSGRWSVRLALFGNKQKNKPGKGIPAPV